MRIEREQLEDRQLQLTVEVSEERSQAALRAAARRLSKNARIPGFRPGKAPYNIVVRQFGEAAVLEEALDSLGQQIYREAIEQEEIQPFAPGSFDEIVRTEPLTLRFTIPLSPEVDLGDYEAVRLDYEQPEVTDETLEEVLENLRQGQALIEPVERPAEPGDVVLADVTGDLQPTEHEEGESLVDEKGVSILLEEETDWPFPGIADELISAEPGSELDLEYTFPDDYPSESLQGRTGTFHLEIQDVKSRLVPQWTDDLAQNLGDFEDLLDLRIKVREQLQEQTTQRAENEYANQVLEAVMGGSQVEFPPVLLEEEIDDIVRDFERQLRGQNLTLEDYLKIEDMSEEALRTEFEARGRDRLKRALILGKVVEVEDLTVEPEEIAEHIDQIMEPFGEGGNDLRASLEAPGGKRRIENDLLTQKAVERLMAIARDEPEEPEPGLEVAASTEEAPAEPAVLRVGEEQDKTQEIPEEEDN